MAQNSTNCGVIKSDNIHVRIKVSRKQYELYRKAAAKDRRSFSAWGEIALDEKAARDLKKP